MNTLKDKQLTAAFMAHNVHAASFNHEQHIRVAYLLLKKHSFLDTVSLYSKGIQTIAAKAGAADKFNLTITFAYLSIIAERMRGEETPTSTDFLNKNNDLLDKGILENLYSSNRLHSDFAKHSFLLPDTHLPI